MQVPLLIIQIALTKIILPGSPEPGSDYLEETTGTWIFDQKLPHEMLGSEKDEEFDKHEVKTTATTATDMGK